ncbi:MAG: ABC transporter ATP-binding protein [Deinococcales bacterium]
MLLEHVGVVMLRLEHLRKSYGTIQALKGISLNLAAGESIALLGPSGCGKTTLLRLVAGLELPDYGDIYLNKQEISRLAPQKRGFGMVFQDYALFPHLKVGKNIAYGLAEQGLSPKAQTLRVAELLEMVGLRGYESRRIEALSGGEQQRIALARALAPKPKVLLFDEPLSNLDYNLREELKREIKQILAQEQVSALYVTHDQHEAFFLADRIAVMQEGLIMQLDTPQKLYSQPKNVSLARFLGHPNIYPNIGKLSSFANVSSPYLLIRQELVGLGDKGFSCNILAQEMRGAQVRLSLFMPQLGISFDWYGYPRELPIIYESVKLSIPQEAVVALEA